MKTLILIAIAFAFLGPLHRRTAVLMPTHPHQMVAFVMPTH